MMTEQIPNGKSNPESDVFRGVTCKVCSFLKVSVAEFIETPVGEKGGIFQELQLEFL